MFTITALLFQQFDLELLTQEPEILLSLGAARPTATMVHFRRKQRSGIPAPAETEPALML